jgi:O-antigen ligase
MKKTYFVAGAALALSAAFAVYLTLYARHWRSRLWFLACSLLIALGLVLSLSRTGVLSAAAMAAVALMANVRRPRILLLGLVAIAALGVGVAQLVPDSVESLTQQIGKDGNDDPSLATRLQDYAELDRLLGPHPWLGRGPNSITTYVSRDGTGMILDNQYLLAIAETGLVGLVVMVGLVVSTGSAAIRRIRAEGEERGLFVAVLCATAAFALMAGTFDVLRFSQASSLFMVVVGLAATAPPSGPSVRTIGSRAVTP